LIQPIPAGGSSQSPTASSASPTGINQPASQLASAPQPGSGAGPTGIDQPAAQPASGAGTPGSDQPIDLTAAEQTFLTAEFGVGSTIQPIGTAAALIEATPAGGLSQAATA
jgi:hypothetical protein